MRIDTDQIRYEKRDAVAVVTLNRPEKHNALTAEMNSGLCTALRDADADDEMRAIVVTGAGEAAFCAGGDLEARVPEMDVEPDEDDVTLRDERLTTPLIAAVNGYCLAAGMEFLLATDLRIAAESATFGLTEPRWGISPMGGSHTRLPRQVPYCKAMEFLLTGDRFSAAHAADAGLVNDVVPDGESLWRALEMAAEIAKNSPHAVRKIKETVIDCATLPEERAFRLETEKARPVFDHPDAEEGMAAFRENREPSFRAQVDTDPGESN